jgi:hypothetical protein
MEIWNFTKQSVRKLYEKMQAEDVCKHEELKKNKYKSKNIGNTSVVGTTIFFSLIDK